MIVTYELYLHDKQGSDLGGHLGVQATSILALQAWRTSLIEAAEVLQTMMAKLCECHDGWTVDADGSFVTFISDSDSATEIFEQFVKDGFLTRNEVEDDEE